MSDDTFFEDLDDALVLALADAFEAEPIPAELTEFAMRALSWRVVDDELATLTFDSATGELIGIRGTTTQRQSLTFEGRGLSVSVTVSEASLVAAIDPPAVHVVSIESPSGPAIEIATGPDGELVVETPTLPVRLVVQGRDGRLVSPWITG